jgi:Fe-S-cluster containining protein
MGDGGYGVGLITDIPFPAQIFKCEQCGSCCRDLFGKRFGSALLPLEVQRLNRLAAHMGVSVNFQPLTADLLGNVTTYQWTDKKCPFLNLYSKCMIYNNRPMLCQAYPCMPFGVGYCHKIARDQRHKTPRFSPEQVAEGKAYMKQVAELVKGAVYVYVVDRGCWELNKR